jgi:hypothetical protein
MYTYIHIYILLYGMETFLVSISKQGLGIGGTLVSIQCLFMGASFDQLLSPMQLHTRCCSYVWEK